MSWHQVALASALILINAIVSWRMRLGMERKIMWACFRMACQLSLLGLVLHHIFALSQVGWVLLLALGMTLIAGLSAVGRIQHRFIGIHWASVFAVGISSWIVTGMAILCVVRPVPWFSAPVLIPLIGMVLGNSLTGISLGLDRFLAEMVSRRQEIEMMLTLGATRSEATERVMAVATRSAMVPILNTMSVAGVVSIPGMMTGQLLAGAPPIQAVQYQIMIMFVIAAAIAMGVIVALLIARNRITNNSHQIQWELIRVLPNDASPSR